MFPKIRRRKSQERTNGSRSCYSYGQVQDEIVREFFCEEFRDTFLKRNDYLHQTGLDASNYYDQSCKPYHEVISDKYNGVLWVPNSKNFPLFHHKLGDSFYISFA